MNKSLSRRAFLRTSIASGASLAAAAAGAAPAGIYRPGTYSAKASGIGEVTVTMTFDADRIIDVVLDVSHETPGIGQAAADTLKKNLMAAQAAEIDGVSGATITSKAVSKAAAKCIAQAKGEIPVEVIYQTALGYNYPLSRRTTLYTAAGWIHNDFSDDYAAAKPTAVENDYEWICGITHKF